MVPSRSSPLHTTLFNMSLNPTNHLARVSTAATSMTTTSWLGGISQGLSWWTDLEADHLHGDHQPQCSTGCPNRTFVSHGSLTRC